MPDNQYLVVELSMDSLSRRGPQFRIVMDGDSRSIIEWREEDRLGHASWRRTKLPDHEHEEVADFLAAMIVAQLRAWPSWFERAAPEYVTTERDKVRACTIRYRSDKRSLFGEEGQVRVAHVEAEHHDRPGTFFHYCRLEVASCDALGVDGWSDCSFEDLPSKYSDPLHQLAETVVSLSGIRHKKDHKAKWYSAQVIPLSRYVECSRGASRSDGDYEQVIACRRCGHVIGPAQ